MIEIKIESNDSGQRLDRFLRKYLKRAPLSAVYKIIRKDLKLNGKRAKEETVLKEGDLLCLYIDRERFREMTRPVKKHTAKRQFKIAYEDESVLIVEKPWGLLTHGDSREKKNTLMNQVCGYLQEKGSYNPASEKTFTPSPVNRLDRNTTGLVIFGKNSPALRTLTKLLRERNTVSKFYLTIVAGDITEPIVIDEALVKNEDTNTVYVVDAEKRQETAGAKSAVSVVRPVESCGDYTLAEVELITGRTHQIRVHLADRGFPLIGDSKYGRSSKGIRANEEARRLGVTTQLLHACRLEFGKMPEELSGLSGLTVKAEIPGEFQRVWELLSDRKTRGRKKERKQ